jgi:hypothetical protein
LLYMPQGCVSTPERGCAPSSDAVQIWLSSQEGLNLNLSPFYRGSHSHVAFEEMVVAQGLGDADRQAPRDEKGDRGAGAPLAVIMHRIWVDGTEFHWTREQAAAA